jgi:hypothetical protein
MVGFLTSKIVTEPHGRVKYILAGFRYDEATNKIQNPVIETITGPTFILPSDFPAEETITWWVYHHQEPVFIS